MTITYLKQAITTSFYSTSALAINAQGQLITFADFWQRVADKYAYLTFQHVSHYAIWSDNSVYFLEWLWAGVLAQKTVILPPHRIAQLEQNFLEQGIVFLDDERIVSASTLTIEQIPDWQIALSRCSILLFTSGSTGQPKQIPRSLAQLLTEVDVLAQQFTLTTPSIYLASVSHQHLYGLTFKVLLPFWCKHPFFTEQCIYPEHIDYYSQWFHQQGNQVCLVLSPALLKRCVGEYTFAGSQRIFSSGGRLEQGVREHYPQGVIEIFGSSETGAIAYRDKDTALWQCLPDVEISQDNAEQLCVKTNRAYQTDWIVMQDRIRLASTTHFELLGRSDRIVKLEEKRLSLDMIEQSIAQLEEVQECSTVVVTHGQREFLSVAVVLTELARQYLIQHGKRTMVVKLKTKLTDVLERIAIPKHWRFIAELPRNTQAKLNRQWVKNLFLNQDYPHILHQQSQAQTVQYRLEFSPELNCFKGHFEGFPVYAGVGQIGFLVQFAQQQWHDLAYCCALEQVKFQSLIRPYDVLDLTLSREGQKICFKMIKQDHHVASGRLVFQLKD